MRLDKYVSHTLEISRSDAKRIIKSGDIKINGAIIKEIGYILDEKKCVVTYNNELLEYQEFVYLMMNKPSGYISATVDKKDKTVLDLVEGYKKYDLAICGRLDKDAVGLIILTNDGRLLHKITSPKSDILKTYYVEVNGEFTEDDIGKFKDGFDILDGNNKVYHTREATLEIISDVSAYITISEGKFHQIKRMVDAIGAEVKYLKRIKIATLILDPTLEEGNYRPLSETELNNLEKILHIKA